MTASPVAWTPVAIMSLDNSLVSVEITDQTAAMTAECVYVWKTPIGDWVRVGTSQAPVGSRLRQYPKHFNATLAGQKSPAPMAEVELWLHLLREHGNLVAHMHQPDLIETVAGNIRPYLDVERVLIKTYKARLLNRSHR